MTPQQDQQSANLPLALSAIEGAEGFNPRADVCGRAGRFRAAFGVLVRASPLIRGARRFDLAATHNLLKHHRHKIALAGA